MIGRQLRRFEKVPAARVGVVIVALLLVVGIALFQKARIGDTIKRGDEIEATFTRDYQLRAHVTKVKMAGVPIGIVTGVDHRKDGTTVATLKLDKGVREKLRAAPSAAIRPTTLLGGNYYVELAPGGDPGETKAIPANRTTVPVELDRVLEVLKPSARASTQRTVRRLDETFDEPGEKALRNLFADAPGSLEPMGDVLEGLQGTNPDTDLTRLVSSLENGARAAVADRGRLDQALVGLAATSRILADTSPQVAQTIADLPDTLRTTRSGLDALGHTLDQLRDVSDDVRPTARELSTTLTRLEPALEELEPVLTDLRPALRDLRPVVDDLVPSAAAGTRILDDVDGAPLDRVRGPIIDVVNSEWHGTKTGFYKDGGTDSVFYKEVGDFIAGMNNAGRMTDRNGSVIHFQPGFGVGSVSGTPISFEQLVTQLLNPEGAP
jgi:phospholipid/cholesterol/gamma-HCH transport system substrate-binding protein